MDIKKIGSSVTAPAGFKALGMHCGIKKTKKDLGLIYSSRPALCSAFFTTNALKSAHIQLDKMHLNKSSCISAIVVNSGNANCCTGRRGFLDALAMAEETAKKFNLKTEEVLVASTGIIGQPLPVKKIKASISKFPALVNRNGAGDFAQSILTTDKKNKEIAVSVDIGGRAVKIGGAAKGAGMINPCLATTLMFITTDAVISKESLKKSSRTALDNSLHLITVDGDMSPNDSLFILANGCAENKIIQAKGRDFDAFCGALCYVCRELAKMLVKDAEGATKFAAIYVKRAKTKQQAENIASGLANSLLFKSMLHGADPNWGRIVSGAGSADKKLDMNKLDVYIGNKKAFADGEPVNVKKSILRKILLRKEIEITIDLKSGAYKAEKYTCDLSSEYVKINSAYRT